ncbi:MAG: signal peptide peptidase SppA [Flavobacteriaceae bacterium]|nr:signal peptide peptidase SppA [Flavobacteriaceae bacterium]
MKFLRNLLATIIGFFIAMGLLFMFFVAIVSALKDEEKVSVSPYSVLEINLQDNVKDYAPKSDDPFEELLGANRHNLGLNQILNAIENAKTDFNIEGISIIGLNANAGMAQLQAIRNKLIDFKTSNKFIYAYADYYSQKGYYLSSVADSIFVNPVGSVDFQGLSSEVLFFKDFQEKSGVKMEVIRHGKYKSAVEPFLSDKMSEANREQIRAFLSSIWNEMVGEMAKSRKKSAEELQEMANKLAIRTPKLALQHQMVDGVIYEDEYRSKMVKTIEIDKSDLDIISLKDYIKTGKGRIIKKAKNKIAVLYAQGEIIYGKGDENYIGQGLMSKAIKKIKKDKSIKALVLRVNSPGGSALSSDIIWRELQTLKEKMPIVVSMGNLAASGGYYISCGADKIYAEPTTITGSIGVFGMFPNFEKLSKNIGINTERVATNTAPYYSPFQPVSEEFKTVVTEGIEDIYKTFVNRVAEGRKMSFEQVDAVAQGRVWSGKDALEKGLVDELGSLEDAIICASELAGIEEYKTRNFPSYKKDFEDYFKSPFASMKTKMLKEELGDAYDWYQQFKQLSKKEGVQARLPFVVNIK